MNMPVSRSETILATIVVQCSRSYHSGAIMTDKTITKTIETSLAEVQAELSEMDVERRVVTALDVAAEFLEFAAYELAQVDEPNRISRLIMLCYDMEKAAQDLRAGVAWPPARQARSLV